MKRLLLLSIILLTACDQEILFDEKNNDNNYLSCVNLSDDNIDRRWRNVILDKTNQSIRSQFYFISSNDFTVTHYGKISDLNDNYDGSAYQWGEHKGMMSTKFELHKTTLNLEEMLRISLESGDDYEERNFGCEVYDDYQSYSKWENSILEELEIEATRQKTQSKKTEGNKKI